MTSAPGSADTGGIDFAPLNINGLVNSGVQAFGIYEAGQTAKKAIPKLNSSSIMYIVLGIGALAVVGLVVLKH
jgi:hypothetical protein